MTLRTPYATLNPEFDGFLFAPIGEERNGMSLSVISALTRLNIDPWQEAGRLSGLSREKAGETLAPIIARLPVGQWAPTDIPAIARRLVDFLPQNTVIAQTVATLSAGRKMRSRAAYAMFAVLLVVVYFGWIVRDRTPVIVDAPPAPMSASQHP